jgi:hypothetical protein
VASQRVKLATSQQLVARSRKCGSPTYAFCIIIWLICKWVFTQWQNDTLHIQTKHRTQSYTSNKAHITHNEYNTKKVKLSLYQAVKACGVVRCRRPHAFPTIGSQIAVGLSALHIGHRLPPETFQYSFMYRLSKPRSHGEAGRIRCTEEKNQQTPSGIKPVTFQLVA